MTVDVSHEYLNHQAKRGARRLGTSRNARRPLAPTLFDRARLRARADLSEASLRFAWAVLADFKAGFDPSQPRDDRGRWSGGAGSGAPNAAVGVEARDRLGHHYVTQQATKDPEFNLPPAARRIFRRLTTGSLGPGQHRFSKEHRQYNEDLRENFRRFLSSREILGSQMTANEAIEFALEILRSNDPRISDLNRRALRIRIYNLIVRFHLRGRE